jgi:hypothetical protein
MWWSSQGSRWLVVTIVAILVLTIAVVLVPLVAAETKYLNGGQWSAYTGYYTQQLEGDTLWYAQAYAAANPAIYDLSVETRGFNNSTGWHQSGTDFCFGTASCSIDPFPFDSTGNNPPSSDRYATSRQIFWPDSYSSTTTYTSHDGLHSASSCWTSPPGC